MPLATGLKLGPYEIVAPIGAGGMGEVYRARDPRLGRDVAVKVLPAAFARDRERLQRFEHEARAAGALNHPGIVAIYDVGTSDGVPFLVSELLEGESLRSLIQTGAVPPRRAAEMTIQAAQALAAAHAKGIVHRDLKPENLHVLVDGRLKVLDFGLAKLAIPDAPPRDETGPQLHSLTMTGTILGTASYMAPEQIREGHVDHRADLFALGAILYELVTGTKAFPGETPPDRMTAILTQDPKPLPPAVESDLPGLDAVIRRCLEKRADLRFDSARDLAFTLQILITASDTVAPRPKASTRASSGARFQQLTYREGLISGARYSSDGHTVVYAAAWGGGPLELYMTRIGSHESRPLGLRDARLLDVSSSDELAVRLRTRDMGAFIEVGVLARLPLMGGTPRELIDGVFEAGFGPGGKIAVIRQPGQSMQLEYPIGTVLIQTQSWMSDPCVSPDGELVAFIDHPDKGNSAGRMAVVDRKGKVRHLSERFPSLWGGAWTPDGREILCSAQEENGSNPLIAVSLDGGVRSVLRAPTMAMIEDVSAMGEVLIGSVVPRMRMEFGRRNKLETTDLSWLEWTLARAITRDGAHVLYDETGPSTPNGMVFIRGTDGSPGVCIGDGTGLGLSPDEKWAMIANSADSSVVDLVPLGAGENVRHTFHPILVQHGAWFPDGKSLCIFGYEPGRGTRGYRYNLEARTVTPITEEGVGRVGALISPDGRWIWTVGPSGQVILPVDGSDSGRSMNEIPPEVRAIRWAEDGRSVFALERGRIPARVFRIDVESGRSEVWMEVHPSLKSAVTSVNTVSLTPDGETYVTSYIQLLSTLYHASGLL
jgi:eukaryotic-like serine/threonine-protein kinase